MHPGHQRNRQAPRPDKYRILRESWPGGGPEASQRFGGARILAMDMMNGQKAPCSSAEPHGGEWTRPPYCRDGANLRRQPACCKTWPIWSSSPAKRPGGRHPARQPSRAPPGPPRADRDLQEKAPLQPRAAPVPSRQTRGSRFGDPNRPRRGDERNRQRLFLVLAFE